MGPEQPSQRSSGAHCVTGQGPVQRLSELGRRGIGFLAKGPGYSLAFACWHLRQKALRLGLVPRTWQKQQDTIWSELDSGSPALVDMDPARPSQHGGAEAAQALLDHFRNRQAPRFFFSWADRADLLALVEPEIQVNTVASADMVAARTFCFRGQPPVIFNGVIDWTLQPEGNVDWMWDLNRHLYFCTLGEALWYTNDRRYAHAFSELLLDWISKNPADPIQPNWASPFEVACRIATWLWSHQLFVCADALDPTTHLALLWGLWTHGTYLDACIELHVPNNHLLLEAKALAMLGLLLPEFRAAKRWRRRGLRILKRELGRQICADGTHAERVPFYHRLVTGELLELAVLLSNNQRKAPTELADGLCKMLDFEGHITRPDGRFPLFGDSAHGDPYVRFSAAAGGAAFFRRPEINPMKYGLNESTIWLLGPARVRSLEHASNPFPSASRAFREGGYVVMRDGWDANGLYLVLDCGPFGYRLTPGHGHADALSFELYAYGQPQIIDSGVYSFHLGTQWRNAFRGTQAHNTVVVDAQDQSELLGDWHVWRPARATLKTWVTKPEFDLAEAWHDGYRRLRRQIVHRRGVFFVKSEYWIIVDLLAGQGRHHYDLYFHLMPTVEIALDVATGKANIAHQTPAGLVICPSCDSEFTAGVVSGSLEPIVGWFSERSGEKVAAPTLCYSMTAEAPVLFSTLLFPYAESVAPQVSCSPLVVRDESGEQHRSQVTGLQIETDRYRDYLVLDHRDHPKRKVFDHYVADGRLAYVRQDLEGMPVKAILCSDNTPNRNDLSVIT